MSYVDVKIDLLTTFKSQGFCKKYDLSGVTHANENFKAAALFRTLLLIDSLHDFEAPNKPTLNRPLDEPQWKDLKTNMVNTSIYQYTKDILYLIDVSNDQVACPLTGDTSYNNTSVTWSDTSHNIFKNFLTVVKNQIEGSLETKVVSTDVYDKKILDKFNRRGTFYGVLLTERKNESSVLWDNGYVDYNVKDVDWNRIPPSLTRVPSVHFLRDVDPNLYPDLSSTAKHPDYGLNKDPRDLYIYLNPFTKDELKLPYFMANSQKKQQQLSASGTTVGSNDAKGEPIVAPKYFRSLRGPKPEHLLLANLDKNYIINLVDDFISSILHDAEKKPERMEEEIEEVTKDSYNSYIFVIMYIINRYVDKYTVAKTQKAVPTGSRFSNRRKNSRASSSAGMVGSVHSSKRRKTRSFSGGGNIDDFDLLLKCLGVIKYTPPQSAIGGQHTIEMNEVIKILCLKRSTGSKSQCKDNFINRIMQRSSCSESISLYDVDPNVKNINLFVDAASKNRCQGYLAQTLKIVQSTYEKASDTVEKTLRKFTLKKTLASYYDAAGKGNIENVLGTLKIWGSTENKPYFITDVTNPKCSSKHPKFAISIDQIPLLQLYYKWDGQWSTGVSTGDLANGCEKNVILVIDNWFGKMDCSGMDGELNGAIERYYNSINPPKDRFCELLMKTMGDFGQVMYYYEEHNKVATIGDISDTLVLFHTIDRFCAGIATLFGKGVVCEQHSDVNQVCKITESLTSNLHNTFYITPEQHLFTQDSGWQSDYMQHPTPQCAFAKSDLAIQKWRDIAIEMYTHSKECEKNLEDTVSKLITTQDSSAPKGDGMDTVAPEGDGMDTVAPKGDGMDTVAPEGDGMDTRGGKPAKNTKRKSKRNRRNNSLKKLPKTNKKLPKTNKKRRSIKSKLRIKKRTLKKRSR